MSVDFATAEKAHKQGLPEGLACSEIVRLNFRGTSARIWCSSVTESKAAHSPGGQEGAAGGKDPSSLRKNPSALV